MAKADHLLSILWLLQSRKTMTAADLSEELEISVRSVYRYIDALCASGVPVISESGHNGGYRLLESFRSSPLFFDPTELKALFQASQFAHQSGYPLGHALNRALDKLKRNISEGQADTIARHAQELGVLSAPRGGPVDGWLGTLEDAVASGTTLDMLYHKATAEEPEWRRIDPYGLAFDAGVWYMAAYCHHRTALRDFRVDRICDIARTAERFERPQSFSLKEYFSNAEFEQTLQTGPFAPVHIRGSVHAVNAIGDHWFLRHLVHRKTRTDVYLFVNDSADRQLPQMLLSFGTDIRVIAPTSLRHRLHQLAVDWANHHLTADKLP